LQKVLELSRIIVNLPSILDMKRNLFLLLFAMSTFLHAQDTLRLDLATAKQKALAHNLALRQTALSRLAAHKEVYEALTQGLFNVQAKAGFTDNITLPEQILPGEILNKPGEFIPVKFGTKYGFNTNVSANLLLFDANYVVAVQAAKAYEALLKGQEKNAKHQALNAVSMAYYATLAARESIVVLASNLSNAEKMLEDMKKVLASGLTEETEVDQMLLNVTRIRNSLHVANIQRALGDKMLNFQMGEPLHTPLVFQDSLALMWDLAVQDAPSWYEMPFSVEEHGLYQSAFEQVRLQKKNRLRYQTAFLPNLSAFGAYTYAKNTQNFDFGQRQGWFSATAWGLNLSLPIFSSGNKIISIQKAKINLDKSKLQLEETSEQLDLQMQQALTDYSSAYASYTNALQNVELSTKILRKTELKFNAGTANSLDYTQALQQALSAQSDKIQSLLALLNAKTKIENLKQNINN
jgi:outer membrane protein TolC